MKKYSLVLLILSVAYSSIMAQSGKISEEERVFLLNYFQTTQAELINTLNEVDDTQWVAKPEHGGWSIAECMEHIIMAEHAVLQQVKKALNGPKGTDDLKAMDGWLLGKITDRGTKVNTPLPPTGNGKTKEEMITEFEASRKAIYAFLADKKLPLRNHYGRSPYGKADAYQLMIVIAGHGMRHASQIAETLASLQ